PVGVAGGVLPRLQSRHGDPLRGHRPARAERKYRGPDLRAVVNKRDVAGRRGLDYQRAPHLVGSEMELFVVLDGGPSDDRVERGMDEKTVEDLRAGGEIELEEAALIARRVRLLPAR